MPLKICGILALECIIIQPYSIFGMEYGFDYYKLQAEKPRFDRFGQELNAE